MATVERAARAAGAATDNDASGAGLDVAPRHVPARRARTELRAIRAVWRRELIRFSRDRLRILTSLIQPFLFLFVLGTGLSSIVSSSTHGVNFRTFIYPGVLCMAVMFTAMFSKNLVCWHIMVRTTVKIPEGLDERLRHEAKRRGVTISDVTRSALEAYLRGGPRRLRAAAAGHSGKSDNSERIEQIISAELRDSSHR